MNSFLLVVWVIGSRTHYDGNKDLVYVIEATSEIKSVTLFPNRRSCEAAKKALEPMFKNNNVDCVEIK